MAKVMSVLQPWASLIVRGIKNIETKPKPTKLIGKILIHSSKGRTYGKSPNAVSCKQLAATYPFYNFIDEYEELPFGEIIGSVEIVRCDEAHAVRSFLHAENELYLDGIKIDASLEEQLGDYTPGRFGILLKNAIEFKEPIPAKGQLGYWNWKNPNQKHVENMTCSESGCFSPAIELWDGHKPGCREHIDKWQESIELFDKELSKF